MISKYEKSNGVKLLAAFMVMAMVVAGAAVVFSEENVNAATTTDTGVVEVTDVTEITQAGKYYINSDVHESELSLNYEKSILYLGSKAVVALGSDVASDLEIRVATSFANGTVYYDSGLSIVAVGSSTYSVQNSGIATSATLTKGFGIVYTPDDAGEKIYYASGSSPSIPALTENQAVIVSNGTVTVSQGTNTATIVGAETGTTGITVTYGATYPSINDTATADGSSITITGGFFLDSTGSSGADDINGIKVTNTSANTTVYTNQFVSKVAAEGDVTAYEIVGNYTQKSSVTVNYGVTVTGTLTINNNATVTIGDGVTMTNSGTIILFGSLVKDGTDGTGAFTDQSGSVKVGPNGYSAFSMGSQVTNTNVISGNDYEVNGDPKDGVTVSDAIIKTSITIPEGVTYTITGNLGLNGKSITVQGTLVIANGASIFGTGVGDEGIIIEGKGAIQNNGTIGKKMPVSISDGTNSISIQGVSGVNFGIVKDPNDNDVLGVSGDIKAQSNVPVSTITIKGAIISGDFTTAKKVTLVVDAESNVETTVDIVKNVDVVINGPLAKGATLSSAAANISVSEGSSVTINGKVTGVGITAEVGKLNDTDGSLVDTVTAGVTLDTNVSGITMSVSRVAVANEADSTKTDYYLRAYVSGNLSKVETTGTGAATLSVDGNVDYYSLYVAAETSLTAGKDITLSMTEGTLVVDGTVSGESVSITNYIGANYTVVTGEGTENEATTVYYTTLAAAMDAIDTAEDKTVYAKVDKLTINVTVKEGQTLDITTEQIAQDATLTIENGGILGGSIDDVQGKMVVYAEADAYAPENYAVVTVDDAGTTTYSGFAIAISAAKPGDVITVESATVDGSLTIPAGVTVNINGTLQVTKDLTVSDEAVLNGGAITVNGEKITVNGTMDVTEGSLTAASAILTSPGTTIILGLPQNFNGAYYNADGAYTITSVAKAVAYAAENTAAVPNVNVRGTVSETGELAVNGFNLIIDDNSDVRLGNIALTNATVTATGDLTASISGLNGEGDAAVNGTVALTKSSVTVQARTVTNAAGVAVNTFAVSGIDGTMTVSAGQVAFTSTDATAESKLTVAAGATMLLNTASTTYSIDGDNVEFIVDGTLAVDGNGVVVNFVAIETSGKTAVIAGTMDISGNAVVNAYALSVTGTVNVSTVENDTGAFDVKDNGVTVGTPAESLGVGGSIVGPVTIDNGMYIVVFAGADMSGAQINEANGESTAVTTEYYINGTLFATAYAEGTVAIGTPVSVAMVKEISGIDTSGLTTTIAWTDADGKALTVSNVGDIEAVYVKFDPAKAWVQYSAGSQISLYVDGVRVTSGDEVQLAVGTHTVTATVNPGYTGDVTITFNGQAVTGEFTVTSDMVGNAQTDAMVLSATGQISVDTGSTSGGDSGMGLTEILLVILVILIVVMAIMVALRLMRS